MKKLKSHTRNQRRMYRIHKQEEKIHDLELLVGSLQQENQKYKEVIDKAKELINKCVELQLENDYLMDRINLANYNMKLLDILKEVE